MNRDVLDVDVERRFARRSRPAQLFDEEPLEVELPEAFPGAFDIQAAWCIALLRLPADPSEQMIRGSCVSSSSWIDAEPAFLAEVDHQLGQVLVADAAPELAVERVDGDLAQGDSCRCPRWLDASCWLSNSVPLTSSA